MFGHWLGHDSCTIWLEIFTSHIAFTTLKIMRSMSNAIVNLNSEEGGATIYFCHLRAANCQHYIILLDTGSAHGNLGISVVDVRETVNIQCRQAPIFLLTMC
jgi:hypothetical protein